MTDGNLPTLEAVPPLSALPGDQKMSPELLRMLGYYIAEANYHPKSILFVAPVEALRQDLQSIFEQLQVPYQPRPKHNLEVVSPAWVEAFAGLCGPDARLRHLLGRRHAVVHREEGAARAWP